MTTAARRSIQQLLILWFTLPLVAVAMWALADEWRFPSLLPTQWGLRGWSGALDQGAAGAVGRSLVLSFLVATLATPLGAATAWWLASAGPRARRLVAGVVLLPVVLPPFALVLGLDTLVIRWSVPASAAVVTILVVLALPYATFVMLTVFDAYDRDYDGEARTLGATPRTVLLRVRLPIVAPGLVAAWFLSFVVGWSDYIVTLVIGAGRMVTAPLLIASQASGTGNEPVVAALAVLTVAPVLALAVLVRRSAIGWVPS